MYHHLETPAQTTTAIFKILSRTLQVTEFLKLEPEAQRLTLEETERLLFSADVLMVNKRSLLTYLQVFERSAVSEGVKELVRSLLVKWHDAPL